MSIWLWPFAHTELVISHRSNPPGPLELGAMATTAASLPAATSSAVSSSSCRVFGNSRPLKTSWTGAKVLAVKPRTKCVAQAVAAGVYGCLAHVACYGVVHGFSFPWSLWLVTYFMENVEHNVGCLVEFWVMGWSMYRFWLRQEVVE